MSIGSFTVLSSDTSASLVRLEGDFDDTGEFERALAELATRSRSIEVDMSAVTFFGSRGLGALLVARRVAAVGGGGLHVVAASSRVIRLLELTALVDLLSPVHGPGAANQDPPE